MKSIRIPLAVLTIVGILFLLSKVVVPKLAYLLGGLGIDLPLPARIRIGIGTHTIIAWPFGIAAVALGVATLYWFRRHRHP